MTGGGAAERLKRRIAAAGPITVAEFMAEALAHPEAGYYTTRDPLGAAGDFTTAPEVSQIFGELLGLWCADTWHHLGRPTPVVLAELGPGRGTLMSDALRAANILPPFRQALDVHLVEISRALRARQARALQGVEATWHDSAADLPEGPLLAIANEFFDALPVRQFEKTPQGWCERMVGYDPEADRLAFALAAPGPRAEAYVPESLRAAAEGAVVEVSPAAISIMHELARRVAAHGGAVLVIDYGRDAPAAEPTLQAVRRHARAEVLAAPGEADLTAHVDFPMLAQAAREAGADAHGPVEQGSFLRALGFEQRAEILKRGATPEQSADIDAARERLCAAEQMGTLFKALAVVPRGFGAPAGFPDGGA